MKKHRRMFRRDPAIPEVLCGAVGDDLGLETVEVSTYMLGRIHRGL